MNRSFPLPALAAALAVLVAAVSCTAPQPAAPAAAAPPPVAPRRPAVFSPNDFRGSDAERINQAIEAAAAGGGRVVIPRVNFRGAQRSEVWLLDSAILLQGGVTLVLDNCRVKLSDRCRDNGMRSANCGRGIGKIRPMREIHIRGIGTAVLEGADRPRATGDSAKTLGKQTYGTDAGVAGQSQKGDWRNIGILLAYVEDFSIRNLAIRDSHAWAVSLERCAHGTIENLDFASTQAKTIDGERRTILNQDGIDLRMGCHDIRIENITGHTGDDLVALTAIPGRRETDGGLDSTMVSATVPREGGRDDIRDIVVKDIRGYCAGGHHIVRLLNTPGARMHDILVDGLTDTSPPGFHGKAAVKIGDRAYGGGMAPLGDTHRITVRHISSRAQHAVLIAGSLADSTISNIVYRGAGAGAVTMESGAQNIRGVTIAGVRGVPD